MRVEGTAATPPCCTYSLSAPWQPQSDATRHNACAFDHIRYLRRCPARNTMRHILEQRQLHADRKLHIGAFAPSLCRSQLYYGVLAGLEQKKTIFWKYLYSLACLREHGSLSGACEASRRGWGRKPCLWTKSHSI